MMPTNTRSIYAVILVDINRKSGKKRNPVSDSRSLARTAHYRRYANKEEFMYSQKNISLISDGDGSGNLTSSSINVDLISVAGIQLIVSSASTLNATAKIQASCDASSPTNWTDISGTSTNLTADGGSLWNLSDLGYTWIRLVYTRTGGSATINARMQIKG